MQAEVTEFENNDEVAVLNSDVATMTEVLGVLGWVLVAMQSNVNVDSSESKLEFVMVEETEMLEDCEIMQRNETVFKVLQPKWKKFSNNKPNKQSKVDKKHGGADDGIVIVSCDVFCARD